MTALFFNHVWQSTLFAGVIAILTLALRHNRARLRYGLWLAASVKFLVPFAMLAAAGGLLEWQQAPAPIRSVVASPGVRDFNAPFAAMWLDPTTMVTAAAQPQWIAPIFFTVWAGGFTAIVLRRLRQWPDIRAAVRASTPFAAATPVPAGIEIRTAPTVLEPGVVGLRRPVILLPEGIDSYLTADQLAAVLAHEVCHVRRRDNLTAAMHMLVEAVFWFHPLVWLIGARLVATREQACDEHVVAETAEPIAYAEGIVSVCRRYVETPHMAVGCRRRDLNARIDAISPADRPAPDAVEAPVLAAAAVVSLVLPIAAGAIEAAAFAAGQLPGATAGGPPIDPADALRGGVHQAVRPIWRRDAAEWDEGDALRLLWFAVAVAGRAGVPCIAGRQPPRWPAGVDQYRALRDRRNDSRRCPGERAAGASDQPAEGSLQDGVAH